MSHFQPDAWLAEILGRPVFRLTSAVSTMEDGALADEMASLARRADAFFYAKLPTSDVPECIALVKAGFAVVETGITLSWGGDERSVAKGISAGIARQDQLEAIPKIAEVCFRWSRFHLDPQIPRNLANLIKRRWIENCVKGKRGSALYAAEIDGTVAGFLAVIESTVLNRPVAIIDLMGVAPGHQGHGVGTALVHSFVSDWKGRASELRVGTQAANIQSLSFYERNGFRIVDSNYALHAHYRNGEIRR